jgi:hypothetical protein
MKSADQLLLIEPYGLEIAGMARAHRQRADHARREATAWEARGAVTLSAQCLAIAAQEEAWVITLETLALLETLAGL